MLTVCLCVVIWRLVFNFDVVYLIVVGWFQLCGWFVYMCCWVCLVCVWGVVECVLGVLMCL